MSYNGEDGFFAVFDIFNYVLQCTKCSLLKRRLEFLAPYIVADIEYEHLCIGSVLEYIETRTVHNQRAKYFFFPCISGAIALYYICQKKKK